MQLCEHRHSNRYRQVLMGNRLSSDNRCRRQQTPVAQHAACYRPILHLLARFLSNMGAVVVDQLFTRLLISWFVPEIIIRCQSQRLSQIALNF